ncbi:DUF5405 family protein [Citrobacter amalonaticus]|uniref:DUF5405 family protein n=1 Tax=Citrobacter amalonaticus TaxID=35703 RepID=UPI0017889ACD|nr:DUF5405 family protein [Citrobacter amalonaticus]MBE0395162.1 DUF5405 family protein [Citrobacter amalonaticus]
MSAQLHEVLLNNWLKVAVEENGHYRLSNIKRDKDTGEKIESTIAIYSGELSLLVDMISLLTKRAIHFKQVTTLDELAKLTAEVSAYCAYELKKLKA